MWGYLSHLQRRQTPQRCVLGSSQTPRGTRWTARSPSCSARGSPPALWPPPPPCPSRSAWQRGPSACKTPAGWAPPAKDLFEAWKCGFPDKARNWVIKLPPGQCHAILCKNFPVATSCYKICCSILIEKVHPVLLMFSTHKVSSTGKLSALRIVLYGSLWRGLWLFGGQ